MAMVDVMVRRRRREARARMGAAIAYGAMGWPVCAAAHPPWPAGFRTAVFRSPGFRATGFGAPVFRSMGRRGTGFGAGQPGGSAQQGFAQPGGMGRACSCDRIGCPDPGAHPLSPAWQIQATVDTAVIRTVWQAQPDANVLLVTGRVFDVLDVPAPAGRIALDALRRYGEEIGPVAVASPDRCLFFVATRGAPVDETEWWSCHLDCAPDSITETPGLRWHCRDSYVLAPPSRHISGHDAHWIRAPEGRPLPDSLRILPVLVDACEEVAG